jgi:hypothetical protein
MMGYGADPKVQEKVINSRLSIQYACTIHTLSIQYPYSIHGLVMEETYIREEQYYSHPLINEG